MNDCYLFVLSNSFNQVIADSVSMEKCKIDKALQLFKILRIH